VNENPIPFNKLSLKGEERLYIAKAIANGHVSGDGPFTGNCHALLVACSDGSIVGFATLRLNSQEEGEGVLFGVDPSAQGRGVYRSFMIRAMEWFVSKGATRMVVSTQVTNAAVQRVWTRIGFEPSDAYYTSHK
jgi:GNAT superfamily N-acetyltransferase